MSDGERIERLIGEWLQQQYPRGPTWYGRAKKEIPALEIRMVPAFNAIEYNMSNGGWAQFLWNCFRHWREVIVTAKEGYLLIGALQQNAALDTMRALCERDEVECREMQRLALAEREKGPDAWSSVFSRFTSRSYSAPANDWEHLFWDKTLYEKRWAWLAANEMRVRTAMALESQ